MRKVLAILAALGLPVLVLAAPARVTITGQVLDPANGKPRRAVLSCKLNVAATAADGTLVTGESKVVLRPDGTIPVGWGLVPNDALSPSGTKYLCTVTALMANGKTASFPMQKQLASSPATIAFGTIPNPQYSLAQAMPAATPSFSPASGTYSNPQSVTISSATPGALLYYSTDGVCPSAWAGTAYTGAIVISSSTSLRAIAVAAGFMASACGSADYSFQAAAPTFSPAAGTYTSVQSVTLTSATPGASIYYTTDGSAPTTSSTPYTAPVSVSANVTLRAMATYPGYTDSAVNSAAYVINLPPVATPTFTPPGGSYSDTTLVTISSSTPGASIYYTTDGSTPTVLSTPYTAPVSVYETETLRAIAVHTGYVDSSASASYALPTPEIFNPVAAGCYATGTLLGSKGTALNISRASTATYRDANGAWQTCQANEIRVGFVPWQSGVPYIISERTVKQIYPTPTAPAAGTVTTALTGAHVFWVEGTGSQTISAGTAVVSSGLPCTATAASPCRFTVGTAGTLTLAAVTGSLARAQIEAMDSPTSFIATANATRANDVITFTTPTALKPDSYCIYAKAVNEQPWTLIPGNAGIITIGAKDAANWSGIWWYSGLLTAYGTVKDAATATDVSYTTVSGPYGAHDFALCNRAGTFQVYMDGVSLGSGQRQPVSHPTTSYLGVIQGTFASNLLLRDVVLTNNPIYQDRGRGVPQICMLGDSITYGFGAGANGGYPARIGRFYQPGRYNWIDYGVSGETLVQMKTRYDTWKSSCSVLTLLGGINDIRVDGTSGAATWTRARAIIDDALSRGIKVLAITTLPRKTETYVAWTQAQQDAQDAYNTSLLSYVPAVHPELYTALDLYSVMESPAGSDTLAAASGSADGIHPGDAGQTTMTTTIVPVLTPLLP